MVAKLKASLAITPKSPRAGGTITPNVSVTGGVKPYAYVWSGLPSSCDAYTTRNTGERTKCTVPNVGPVNVSVRVTDSATPNHTVTVTHSLTVKDALPAGTNIDEIPILPLLVVAVFVIIILVVLVGII